MLMEFDQYLQPCDVLDGRYMAAVDPRTSKPQPPRLDLYRAAAAATGGVGVGPQSTAAAASSKAGEPPSDQDAGGGSPRDNRCTWECNFDNDDAETILTSETDDVSPVLDVPSPTLAAVDADRGSQDAAEATRDAWLSLSPVAVDSKPWSSPTLGSRRKHMSLPANLPSLLRSGDPRSAENRRRHPSTGVRFADEVGENLMTFAIIPSRHDVDGLHQQTPAAVPPRTQSTPSSAGRSSATTATRRRLHIIDHYRAMASFGVTDASSWLPENFSSSSLSSDDDDRGPDPRRPAFRLSFDQPAADPASFHRRLDAQMVCLENAKVVGDVALCSVRVRCVQDCPGSTRRVLARCTNDDWLSFADISAHPVGGGVAAESAAADGKGSSRGPLYETLSFAVKRPKSERSAAVEFALCYRVDDRAWWDNNDGRNYRVEWLR